MSESDERASEVAPTEPAEQTEPAPEEDEASPEQPESSTAGSRARQLTIMLTAVLAASVALTCWLFFGVFRVDQQLGPDAEQEVMAAAADGTVAVLTYSPKTLEKDFANAESHLTGDFLSYYADFTQKVVTPAAKQKEVQTAASVVRKGIVSLRPTTAEVLIFVNQTTISKANPDGSFSMSSVKVGLQKHDGRWLISSFDPV